MGNISLLDCTLRDGGYVNDWNFGETAIKEIGRKIIQAGIEIFEIGFIKDVVYDKNRTVFSSVEDIRNMIQPKNSNTLYVGMLDMSAPLPLEKLSDYDGTSVDALRVIFKKNKIQEGFEYSREVKKKGYKLFVQPVGTDGYSDVEFVELIEKFNELNPTAFYIVDTFGIIKKKQFLRLLHLADHNLKPEIALGYHSHNNLQQASGNAEAMTECNMQRDIMLDACVFGMGRGAGNLNMELFAEYLNENFGKSYRIEPMLEIIDDYLNDIYNRHFWGYSLPFYLSASNNCHPNYAIFYAQKGTLTVKAFNELLKSITEEDKVMFSKEKAEEYYRSFQEQYIDDREAVKELFEQFSGRNVLVLAPGKTLETNKEKIKLFIQEKQPITICVNFFSKEYGCDYIFSSNIRRYHKLENIKNVKKIITSNVKEAVTYDYKLNFSSYCLNEPSIIDNSGMMLLNFLIELGLNKVYFAGFDGYDADNKKNYVNSGLEYAWTNEDVENRNRLISDMISEKSKMIDIEFLTKSCYLQ